MRITFFLLLTVVMALGAVPTPASAWENGQSQTLTVLSAAAYGDQGQVLEGSGFQYQSQSRTSVAGLGRIESETKDAEGSGRGVFAGTAGAQTQFGRGYGIQIQSNGGFAEAFKERFRYGR